jgi:hypothetical protein
MIVDEVIQISLSGGYSDLVRNVDGEEVAGLEEAIHCAQVDVIGIAEVRMLPFELMDSGIRRGARLRRFGTDDGVLPIRLVPYGHHLYSRMRRPYAGAQLRLGLVHKPVAYPDRKSA